jgi:coproporphyrinogen III oxidase
MNINLYKKHTSIWFENIRDKICLEFENIESNFAKFYNIKEVNKFDRKKWKRSKDENIDLGGGESSIMTNGLVFESVAVNISTVYGELPENLFNEIKKNQNEFKTKDAALINSSISRKFYATGISLIAHMKNPHVPAVHFNTRFILNGEDDSEKFWFGGGYDLTPLYIYQDDYDYFHNKTKEFCDIHNKEYYSKFKKQCDEYFYLHHRKEPRGIGGIFYDYLNNDDFEKDFMFTKDVGLNFLMIYSNIVNKNMYKNFNESDREALYFKRGRYVEFNLLYDRGTRFGLLTGGNVNSILSSMPPIVKWKNEDFI